LISVAPTPSPLPHARLTGVGDPLPKARPGRRPPGKAGRRPQRLCWRKQLCRPFRAPPTPPPSRGSRPRPHHATLGTRGPPPSPDEAARCRQRARRDRGRASRLWARRGHGGARGGWGSDLAFASPEELNGAGGSHHQHQRARVKDGVRRAARRRGAAGEGEDRRAAAGDAPRARFSSPQSRRRWLINAALRYVFIWPFAGENSHQVFWPRLFPSCYAKPCTQTPIETICVQI